MRVSSLFPARLFRSISLQKLLLLTTISQVLSAVSLVGYLSFKNSQKAVEDLAEQLMNTTSYRVHHELEDYLATPLIINHLNVDAVKTGLLSLDDPQAIEDRLWNQFQAFESTSYIYISSLEGGSVAVGRDPEGNTLKEQTDSYPKNGDYRVFRTDKQGTRTKLLQIIRNQDATQRPWFKQPVAAKKPIWIQPFSYVNRESIIAISASSPLYDKAGGLQGVATVDISLDHLSDFLHEISPDEQSQVFIMERTGKLLAASEPQPIIVTHGRAEIIQARRSPNPLIRKSVQMLEAQANSQANSQAIALSNIQQHRTTLTIKGEPYFVQVNPWQDEMGLDWLVVVVVPQSKFMAQIQANNRITVGLFLLLAAIATALATAIARRISTPLSKLSAASQTLTEASRQRFAESPDGDNAREKLNPTLKTSGIQEVNTLALNFEHMSKQLQKSYDQLEEYSHALEAKVSERTQSLEQEITVRKQAEAQSLKAKEAAEVASQVKSEFLTNMSHELRSPLNAILGFAMLMQQSRSLSAEHREHATIINRSGEHLLSLINGVLDMSKLEAGRMAYRPAPLDLYRLLDDLRNMFQLRAAEKQILFDFDYAPDLPPYIVGDQGKLRQVVINLLSNAIKFTEAGKVTLKACHGISNREISEAAITIYFEIQDTGHGLAKADIDQVFEPFFQTRLGENTPEGTGLGLPISRKFVQLMGGELTLTSAGIGKGTTAAFSIQSQIIQHIEPQTHPLNQQVVALAPNQPPYRLLIVDDKSENRKLLTQILQPLGFDLKEVSNGQAAIEVTNQWHPHLIWMDMRMPILDGYKATQQIRKLPTTLRPKIVALSASSFREEQINARTAGCDDFIHKPFHANKIFEAMGRHLGVRYLYDSEVSATEDKLASNRLNSGSGNGLLENNRLATISPELLEALDSATRRLQWDRILHIIEQIRVQDEPLAEALTSTVHSFHYEHILQAIQSANAALLNAAPLNPALDNEADS